MDIYYTSSRPDALIDIGLESDVITAYGHKEIGVDRLHLYTQDTVNVYTDGVYIDTGVVLHVPKPVLFVVQSLHSTITIMQRVRPHGLLFYEIVHLFIGVRSTKPIVVPAHTVIAELQGFALAQRVYFVYKSDFHKNNTDGG